MGEFPSRDHQFQPGNQASKGRGRPKGKSISTLFREIGEAVAFKGKGRGLVNGPEFREMLEQAGLVYPEDGQDAGDESAPRLSFNHLAALRAWAILLHDGDPKNALAALKLIQDRQEGRAPLPIKNDESGPLEIRVVYADHRPGDPEAAPGPGDDPPGDEAL